MILTKIDMACHDIEDTEDNCMYLLKKIHDWSMETQKIKISESDYCSEYLMYLNVKFNKNLRYEIHHWLMKTQKIKISRSD